MILLIERSNGYVIPAQAGIHATLVAHSDTCMGARLRGHDEP
jgi:hypothetical protein